MDCNLEHIVTRAVEAAAAIVPDMVNGELSVACVDDTYTQKLNRDYRGKDKPANVLSFPSTPPLLGDIVLAYGVTEAGSDERGIAFSDHLAHLTVHGFLHLLGYDHQTDEEAANMEALEVRALAKLDIDNPYIISERN